MKFFIDTADVDSIKQLASTGLIDGVTTNPSLIAASGASFKETVKTIASLVEGPVSAEVASTDYEAMRKEAHTIAGWASNIAVKLPLTVEGLKVCHELSRQGIKTNVTLCFTVNQAILAAKAGATFISPFIGRADDIHMDGIQLIRDIVQVYNNYNFKTEVLAASIRTPAHIRESAIAGAHVATIPPKVFNDLYKHPLTDIGLDIFKKDWAKTGQSILD